MRILFATLIALSCAALTSSTALADAPKKVTKCGQFEIRNSDGMLPVVVKLLIVEMPSPMEGLIEYRLSAGGNTMQQLDRREKLLQSMVEGRRYCVTGPVNSEGVRPVLTIDKVKEM